MEMLSPVIAQVKRFAVGNERTAAPSTFANFAEAAVSDCIEENALPLGRHMPSMPCIV